MKVIQFITSIDKKNGGTVTFLELLTRYLGRLVDLHVVSAMTDNPMTVENANVHYVDCVGISNLLKLKKQWSDLLEEIKPDIVHSNGIWEPQSWIIQHEAQKRGIKVVITPHGMMEPWCVHNKAWKKKIALFMYQRRSIREADYLHATTELEKSNMLLWREKTPIEVIPLGIGCDEIAVKSSWIKKKKALFLSRVHEKKGIEFLLDAVRSLKETLSGYEFIIAGEGEKEYVDRLKRKAEEYGIDGMLNFVGGVYGDAKWQLYREADFFILPTYCENFGYVIAEALAVGTPVITTRNTPWESLEQNKCGYYVPLDMKSIIEALSDMTSKSDEELKMMGMASRKLIETHCNSSKVAASMVELYNKILCLK